ncbi:MAG TPA: hypothetical protein DD640_09995 [Clostridiales bacterium]|nr:hypothetical protein [Clostridiales bacterium]
MTTDFAGIKGRFTPPGFCLPRQPAVYELTVRLVLTSREPFRSQVLQLYEGQPLRLHREADNEHDCQAIRVETLSGCVVGYLPADIAAWLSILLDHYADLTDQSFAECILSAAPPGDPAARRLRYPKLKLRLRLALASAWPLFAIAAVLGLKTDNFASRFNLAGNPWLAPLGDLHEQYRQAGHDRFELPDNLVRAWKYLTE